MSETPPDRPPGASGLPVRYFLAVAWFAAAVSLLKGLRMPNRWATTHLTFNWSEGFVRRGLIGEILWLVGRGHLWSYRFLVGLSLAIFVVVAALTARVAGRMLRADPDDPAVRGAVLVLAASPAVVCLANLVGYLDHIGLGLLLAFILWSSRAGAASRYRVFAVAAPLGVLWALIHESQVVMFGPVMVFALLCHVVQQHRQGGLGRRDRLLLAAAVAGVTALALAASAAISLAGTRSPALLAALQLRIARTADFPLRDDAFHFLGMPARYNLFTLMLPAWRQPENLANLFRGFALLFTSAGFLLYYGVRLTGRVGLGPGARAILVATLFGATLAPLSLNLVGWDTARWDAIAAVDAFCCVAILRLFFSARAPDPRAHRLSDPLLLTLAAAAVILSLSSSYGSFLLGGRTVHWFPFDAQVSSLVDLLTSPGRFVSPD